MAGVEGWPFLSRQWGATKRLRVGEGGWTPRAVFEEVESFGCGPHGLEGAGAKSRETSWEISVRVQ